MNLVNYEQLVKKFPQGIINSAELALYFNNIQTMRVALSRWQKKGRLIKLRQGIYLLPEHYRKSQLFDLAVACLLLKPSYISLEKALEFHGLIPEGVAVYTLVTPRRENKFQNSLGFFKYQHLKQDYFFGYLAHTVGRQTAYIAEPEKALLDLFYLKRINPSVPYLENLRLQNTERISPEKLLKYAARFGKPGIIKKAEQLSRFLTEFDEGVTL